MKLPPIFSRRRRSILLRLLAIALAQSMAALGLAWLVRGLLDRTIHAGALPLWAGLIVALALIAVVGVLRRWESIEGERMAQSYVHRLRRALFERLCRSDVGELQRVHRGALLLRFVGDLSSISEWVSAGIARLWVTALTTVLTLGMLATYDLRAAALVAVLLAAGFGITALLGKGLNQAMIHARRLRARLAANIAEKSQGFAVVNAFAQGGREGQRMRRQSARLKSALIERARRSGAIDAVADATAALAIVGMLGLGALERAGGRVSFGVVAACVAIVAQLAGPIRDSARTYERWCRFKLSRDKIRAFLRGGRRRPAFSASYRLPAPVALELRDVALADRLRSVSEKVPAGSRVAVWGPVGGGKSTLLAILAGAIRPDAGTILLASRDLAAYSALELRTAVGWYSSDLSLLRGSVERNLRYRVPESSAEGVQAAGRAFGVDAMLARWSLGAQTRVAEGGANFSLGERQRLCLARSWLGRPAVLLLDDLDGITDPALRSQLRAAIAAYSGTVVMVTQQSDLLAIADISWRLAGGRVTETQAPARDAAAAVLIAQAVASKERST